MSHAHTALSSTYVCVTANVTQASGCELEYARQAKGGQDKIEEICHKLNALSMKEKNTEREREEVFGRD